MALIIIIIIVIIIITIIIIIIIIIIMMMTRARVPPTRDAALPIPSSPLVTPHPFAHLRVLDQGDLDDDNDDGVVHWFS